MQSDLSIPVAVRFMVIFLLFISLQCDTDIRDEIEIPERIVTLEILTTELADNEDFFFYRPVGIERDSRGNLYVIDAGEKNIVKFSPDGNFIRYIGRSGDGPGEFQMPMGLTFDREDNLYVLDFRTSRISLFTNTGEYIKSFNYTDGWFVSSISVNNNGEIALHQPEMDKPLINIVNRDGGLLRSMGETEPLGTLWNPVPSPVGTMSFNSAAIRFNDKGDIFVAYGPRPYIQRFSKEGEMTFYKQLEGAEIDSLREEEQNIIEQIKREHGTSNPDMVFVISYISGFYLPDDEIMMIGLARQNTIYVIDGEGSLIEKVHYKGTKDERYSFSGGGSFIVTGNNELIMLDHLNGLLWKGQL